MNKYSIAQVEALTGIKGHTIRVWERRYNFLEPERTSTNIRYYSDKELRKLLNVAILNKNGVKISKIDKMSEGEINDAILDIFSQSGPELSEEINKLTLCMLDMDEVEFERLFQKQLVRFGLVKTITEVIYPFLKHVGVLWTTQKAMPAHEHFVTNLIRQKIITSVDSLPQVPPDARSVLLFLAEDEHHEIGLLLASFIAKDLGWRVYYLGQNVPTENVLEVVDFKQPSYLLTILTSPVTKKYKQHINALRERLEIPILTSGSPENFKVFEPAEGEIIFLRSPQDLVEFLQEHRKN